MPSTHELALVDRMERWSNNLIQRIQNLELMMLGPQRPLIRQFLATTSDYMNASYFFQNVASTWIFDYPTPSDETQELIDALETSIRRQDYLDRRPILLGLFDAIGTTLVVPKRHLVERQVRMARTSSHASRLLYRAMQHCITLEVEFQCALGFVVEATADENRRLDDMREMLTQNLHVTQSLFVRVARPEGTPDNAVIEDEDLRILGRNNVPDVLAEVYAVGDPELFVNATVIAPEFRPLGRKEIAALEGRTCNICQEVYRARATDDEAPVRIACENGHIFHLACIRQWWTTKIEQNQPTTCPYRCGPGRR